MNQEYDMHTILSQYPELRTYSVEEAVLISTEAIGVPIETILQHNNVVGDVRAIFRDQQCHYWWVNVDRQRWMTYDAGHWHESVPPEGRLEASEALCVYLFDGELPFEYQDSHESDALLEQEPPDFTAADTKNAMITIVRDTYNDYQQGLITSLAARHLLNQYCLVDQHQQVWNIGCRSGQWYCFSGEQWHAVEDPPDDLIVPATNAELNPAIVGLYASDAGLLPEEVSNVWLAPILPVQGENSTRQCLSCGEALLEGVKFCTHCGVKVAPETLEEPKQRRCGYCSAVLANEDKFCTQCGQRITSNT